MKSARRSIVERGSPLGDAPGPLYQKIKRFILAGIADGTYGPHEKLPSEHTFVERFGVARMTVHRAMRELSAEGALVRMPGVGTFVSEPKPQSAALELRDIKAEILSRGNRYDCQVIKQEGLRAPRDVCGWLELDAGSDVYHGLILHFENGRPAQLEERFIIERFAEGFLDEDLGTGSLYAFLLARSAPTQVEHVIAAAQPKAVTVKLLQLQPGEPILVIRRRTWVDDAVAVLTRFTYPGNRYNVSDRHNVAARGQPADRSGG